jgi:lipopolysaccharide heptosyltransferase I
MDRLLVVRLGSLGDLVHTLPAVTAIRRAHPALEIDWLVDAVHREFLELVPIISAIVTLRDRSAKAWLDARRALRSRRYDVAADFQGLLKSAALARLSGATRVIGFGPEGLRERSAGFFYTDRTAIGEGQHVIQKNLELAAKLGAAAGPLEFPIAAVESKALDALRSRGLSRFALLNPGAAWPNKRWPPERFGRVARHLRDRHSLASVVIWGPHEDSVAQAVVDTSDGAAILAPPTGLTDIVAIARASTIMVSGDTGPTHIAAAVGTLVVAPFGPTNPRRNGPWRDEDRTISRYETCDCHYERRCRRATGWCLGTIEVDEITAAIDTILVASSTGRSNAEIT